MFPIIWRVKDIFSLKSSAQVWPSAAKGVLVLFSCNTSLHGSQIPLNTMHVRAGRAKTRACAFNPHVILLLFSLTPVAWGVKILYGKGGSSLASVLMGFTEHEEVCGKLLGWLTALRTQLPGLWAPSWWGEHDRNKENQADPGSTFHIHKSSG